MPSEFLPRTWLYVKDFRNIYLGSVAPPPPPPPLSFTRLSLVIYCLLLTRPYSSLPWMCSGAWKGCSHPSVFADRFLCWSKAIGTLKKVTDGARPLRRLRPRGRTWCHVLNLNHACHSSDTHTVMLMLLMAELKRERGTFMKYGMARKHMIEFSEIITNLIIVFQ